MTHKLFKGLASFALSLSMIGSALPVMAQSYDDFDQYFNFVTGTADQDHVIGYKMYSCGYNGNFGSLEVDTKSRQYSGIVIGWTHKWIKSYNNGKEEVIRPDRYINVDKEDFERIIPAHVSFDGWWTTLDETGTGPLLKGSLLPFDTDDPANNTLYLHWHDENDESINQVSAVKDYLESIKWKLNLTTTKSSVCKGQTVRVTADIKAQSTPSNSLTWNVKNGKIVEQGFRYIDVLVDKNATGTLDVTASIKPQNDPKTGAPIPMSDYKTLKYGSEEAENKVETTINVPINSDHVWKKYGRKDGNGNWVYDIDYLTHETYYERWTSMTCDVCGYEWESEREPINHSNQSYGGGFVTPPQKEEPKEPEQTDDPNPDNTETPEPEPEDTPKEPEPAPSQPEPEKHEVNTELQDEIQLSDKQVETKTEIVEDKEVTKTTYEDLHEETKVESEKAVSNYVETVDHTFAGAQVDVKETAAPSETVKVEMKAIPVSAQASQPIILNASNDAKVSLPVENANWGTVALLVDGDGKTYSIDSSYYDGNGNIVIPVNKNMKVVLQNRALEFADVTGDINSYPANNIAFLSARGIMTGKGDGTNFDPEGNLTRGQLALMLYRKAGEPAGYNNSSLPEGVAAESYYANAARWAAGTGLMAQGGSAFNGDKAITREQMALILYRQSGANTVQTASLSNYSDAGFISSDDAKNAIAWNVEHNIMGNGTTSLNPQENTKRQDVAAMIARYIQPEIAKVQ